MNPTIESLHSTYTERLRRRRFAFFQGKMTKLDKPVRLLDCGGTLDFWTSNGVTSFPEAKLDVTIINMFQAENVPEGVRWIVGDVRDLAQFGHQEFDVVFSNAVINLMPTWDDQRKMAGEMIRVGRRYFVQSPNRYYPLDWRTLVPFFHFLSPAAQAWCFMHFRVGRYARVKDRAKAQLLASRVRDLSLEQMQSLFPGCGIFHERWFGFTKSLTAYGGAW